ncbi:cutinase family protein [Arthrobacter sp. 2MCAF14]|uniref:cutinase family protein n=1 Tax=Arthrobacter sp. 2MCAF14 TaxID=3232982 RepID=UPI003F90F37F
MQHETSKRFMSGSNHHQVRRRKSRSTLRLIATWISAVLFGSTLVLVNVSAASADGAPVCKDVNLIGLAGSGELDQPGSVYAGYDSLGKESTSLYKYMAGTFSDTGTTISAHGIPYKPVSISALQNIVSTKTSVFGSKVAQALGVRDALNTYTNSVDLGVSLTVLYIDSFIQSGCQGKLVLSGYSQGADVLMRVYGKLDHAVQKRVSAVVLFGDPYFGPQGSFDRGSFVEEPTGIGVAPYAVRKYVVPYLGPSAGLLALPNNFLSADLAAKTRSFCLDGDPVCNATPKTLDQDLNNCIAAVQGKAVDCPHFDYNGSTEVAAAFVYDKIWPASRTNIPNWAGVSGKPKAIGTSPVTHAETSFDIPFLTCDSKPSQVSYWTGMDTVSAFGATKAGVIGDCKNGLASWSAFFQTPAVSAQPIPGLGVLRGGDHVRIQVDYKPNIAPDAFTTDIIVYPVGAPGQEVVKTFYSNTGANLRSRVDCILEKNAAKPGESIADFPYFSLASTCLGGTDTVRVGLPSVGAAYTLSNIISKGKLLTEATRLDPGLLLFWWAAGK